MYFSAPFVSWECFHVFMGIMFSRNHMLLSALPLPFSASRPFAYGHIIRQGFSAPVVWFLLARLHLHTRWLDVFSVCWLLPRARVSSVPAVPILFRLGAVRICLLW